MWARLDDNSSLGVQWCVYRYAMVVPGARGGAAASMLQPRRHVASTAGTAGVARHKDDVGELLREAHAGAG